MDREIFKELGFSEREIKVYTALLELGLTKVGPIASRSKLQHSKVYQTLDKLIEKGLVSYIVVSKTKHFQASDPQEILNIIEERKKRFENVLKELKEKQKYSDSKQIAIVHEGFKSMKALFSRIAESLSKNDHYWAFAFRDGYDNSAITQMLVKFHEKLREKKIDDRIICHFSLNKKIREAFKRNTHVKIRSTKNEIPLGTIIIENKVISLIYGERPTAVEVTSDQLYNQYKNFFLDIWNKSK